MFKFSTSKAFSVLQAEACPSLFILLLKRFTYKKLWVVHLPAGLVHAKKLNSPQIYYDCKSSFSSCRYSEGYWNLPTFQVLLHKAEEFGSDHPMGCPRIPCREDIFLNLTSHFTVDNFVKNECNPMYILFSFLCNFFFFFFLREREYRLHYMRKWQKLRCHIFLVYFTWWIVFERAKCYILCYSYSSINLNNARYHQDPAVLTISISCNMISY